MVGLSACGLGSRCMAKAQLHVVLHVYLLAHPLAQPVFIWFLSWVWIIRDHPAAHSLCTQGCSVAVVCSALAIWRSTSRAHRLCTGCAMV
jgi:hypothetical protein